MSKENEIYFDIEIEGIPPEIDGRAILESMKDSPPPIGTKLEEQPVIKLINCDDNSEYRIVSGKIPTKAEVIKYDITGVFLIVESFEGGDRVNVLLGFDKEGNICGKYKSVC
jgi:hypothetical protein